MPVKDTVSSVANPRVVLKKVCASICLYVCLIQHHLYVFFTRQPAAMVMPHQAMHDLSIKVMKGMHKVRLYKVT